MNIFYLDQDPEKCAEYHCDKHVVKMILETAQLLSTAHRVLDGWYNIKMSKNNRQLKYWKLSDVRDDILYQVFGVNHPVALWVRLTSDNYFYALELFKYLNEEYEFRYGRIHKSKSLLSTLNHLPNNITIGNMTSIALAMPEIYYSLDPVQAYRNYYRFDKKEILNYTKRNKPDWL